MCVPACESRMSPLSQRWDLAIANGSVWVAHWGDGTVTRIDARSGRVRGRPITVGTSEPSIGIAVGDGAVWVARPAGDSVTRILP